MLVRGAIVTVLIIQYFTASFCFCKRVLMSSPHALIPPSCRMFADILHFTQLAQDPAPTSWNFGESRKFEQSFSLRFPLYTLPLRISTSHPVAR